MFSGIIMQTTNHSLYPALTCRPNIDLSEFCNLPLCSVVFTDGSNISEGITGSSWATVKIRQSPTVERSGYQTIQRWQYRSREPDPFANNCSQEQQLFAWTVVTRSYDQSWNVMKFQAEMFAICAATINLLDHPDSINRNIHFFSDTSWALSMRCQTIIPHQLWQ